MFRLPLLISLYSAVVKQLSTHTQVCRQHLSLSLSYTHPHTLTHTFLSKLFSIHGVSMYVHVGQTYQQCMCFGPLTSQWKQQGIDHLAVSPPRESQPNGGGKKRIIKT